MNTHKNNSASSVTDKHSTIIRRIFPEAHAGGFSHRDGTIEFYTRVNALLTPEMKLLDFGAGRGHALVEDKVEYRRRLRNFRGRCQKVVGIDIDDVVKSNPGLDEAVLIQPNQRLPFDDATFDLIICDWVFEHFIDPAYTTSELGRVLNPGGWLCARTPNRWGYISIGARFTPNRLHEGLLRILQPGRQERDEFPTYYRLNTMRALRKYFSKEQYLDASYYYTPEPAYFNNKSILWRLAMFFERVMPAKCGPVLMVFLQKN